MVRIWNYGSNQDKAGVEANDRIGFDTVILAIVEIRNLILDSHLILYMYVSLSSIAFTLVRREMCE